jgi:hypothetical protein
VCVLYRVHTVCTPWIVLYVQCTLRDDAACVHACVPLSVVGTGFYCTPYHACVPLSVIGVYQHHAHRRSAHPRTAASRPTTHPRLKIDRSSAIHQGDPSDRTLYMGIHSESSMWTADGLQTHRTLALHTCTCRLAAEALRLTIQSPHPRSLPEFPSGKPENTGLLHQTKGNR